MTLTVAYMIWRVTMLEYRILKTGWHLLDGVALRRHQAVRLMT